MHPLIRLIATRPQLLTDHAEAYAALVAAEVPRISAAWKRSALLNVLALCSLIVGTSLAGVSVMLWSVTPPLPMHALWPLLTVPLLPLIAGLACAVVARNGHEQRDAFEELRQQVKADIAVLREAALA